MELIHLTKHNYALIVVIKIVRHVFLFNIVYYVKLDISSIKIYAIKLAQMDIFHKLEIQNVKFVKMDVKHVMDLYYLIVGVILIIFN